MTSWAGDALLEGSGTLKVDTVATSATDALLAGSGAIEASAVVAQVGATLLANAGSLAAEAFIERLLVGASLTGVGALADNSLLQLSTARATFDGRAALAASERLLLQGAAALAATSTLVPQDMQRYANPTSWGGAALLDSQSSFGSNTVIPANETGAWRDLVNRVKMLIPHRWFSWVAPIRDAILGGLADQAAWCYSWITYARQQSRIATSTGIWLDIIAYDYLRRYLRRGSSSDTVFRKKILATILQERVTRAGMMDVILQLVGISPMITEPWNTGDCGGYGVGNIAYGRIGAWGSIELPGQIFMKISRSGLAPTGVPGVDGYGGSIAGYGAGPIEYIGSSTSQIGVTNEDIYEMIQATKPTGVICWTRID